MVPITIAGNWKMNKTKDQVLAFFTQLAEVLPNEENSNLVKIICPTFPLISLAVEKATPLGISIGAQDVSIYGSKGAYTGEVSYDILSSVGIKYCIIGHSERRQYFKETDNTIKHKWLSLRSGKIIPIICVGETLDDRESGKTFDVLLDQLYEIFEDIEINDDEDLIVAYEPVWAIGTGRNATPEQAQEVHKFIRSILFRFYGYRVESIPILYGGSVKESNIKDLLAQEDINGALVGGASLDANEFAALIKAVK